MSEYHNTPKDTIQESVTYYRATKKNDFDLVNEADYYTLGIYFVIKHYNGNTYDSLVDISSKGNKLYFNHCLAYLKDHGYIEEVTE